MDRRENNLYEKRVVSKRFLLDVLFVLITERKKMEENGVNNRMLRGLENGVEAFEEIQRASGEMRMRVINQLEKVFMGMGEDRMKITMNLLDRVDDILDNGIEEESKWEY